MAALKPSQVAALWACSAGQVRKLCRTGQLRAMRLGSDWRISQEAVSDFEAAHTTSAPAQQTTSVTAITVAPSYRPAVEIGGEYEPIVSGSVPWRSSVLPERSNRRGTR